MKRPTKKEEAERQKRPASKKIDAAEPTQRKRRVLKAVVREYVDTAEPVGSETVRVKYRFDCSPATIRNDMVELEDDGLLVQPHTSAGRIPTDSGYRAYVDEFTARSALVGRKREQLAQALAMRALTDDTFLRDFARTVADITGETVVMSFGPNRTVLAGVSNLARQPEFHDTDAMFALTRAIDDIELSLVGLRRALADDISVLIGQDNPFGNSMSSITTRCRTPQLGEGTITVIGPTRMDYDVTLALTRYLRDFLS